MLFEIGVLKNLAKLTEKRLCQSPFFENVADLRPTTLLKTGHRYFAVNFVKFLRTLVFLQHHQWLLLCNSTEYE